MPTYEYGCTSCGQHIEVFQRFSEDPLTTCGNCGGALRKVFHPAGIVFKGSGFYATDSRAKRSTTTTAAKKDTDAGSSATGSDGAPAAPTGSSTASGEGGSTKKANAASEGS